MPTCHCGNYHAEQIPPKVRALMEGVRGDSNPLLAKRLRDVAEILSWKIFSRWDMAAAAIYVAAERIESHDAPE